MQGETRRYDAGSVFVMVNAPFIQGFGFGFTVELVAKTQVEGRIYLSGRRRSDLLHGGFEDGPALLLIVDRGRNQGIISILSIDKFKE